MRVGKALVIEIYLAVWVERNGLLIKFWRGLTSWKNEIYHRYFVLCGKFGSWYYTYVSRALGGTFNILEVRYAFAGGLPQ